VLIVVLGGTLLGGVVTLFSWLARGRLTLDADVGRSVHPLGPLAVEIDAPRELVFEHLSAPYLGRTPRETAATVDVIERGSDMVVARHVSKVAFYTSETVESVRFEAPGRISFRHLRGPVPHAVEAFELVERDGGTELVYTGELGIDFWLLGRLAGRYWVTPTWIGIVREHLDQVKTAAEARAEARRRREQRHGAGEQTAGGS
jgi:Polyketide cyclase / dehydrase and lipid transport